MRTASEQSETKDRLLKVATELMIEKGFVATTVDDICEAAKVTKGAFFHYFGTKEDLAEEAIAHFSERMRENFKACCPEAVKDPLDRIYAIVDGSILNSQRSEMKGCLVGSPRKSRVPTKSSGRVAPRISTPSGPCWSGI